MADLTQQQRRDLLPAEDIAHALVKLQRFLGHVHHLENEAPMWVAGGICITFGDLRLIGGVRRRDANGELIFTEADGASDPTEE